jgi:hypothetical protein
MPQGGGGPGGAPAPGGGAFPNSYGTVLQSVIDDLAAIATRIKNFNTTPANYSSYAQLRVAHSSGAPDEWSPWRNSALNPLLENLRDFLVYLMTCENYFDPINLTPGQTNQSDWPTAFRKQANGNGDLPINGYVPTLAARLLVAEIAKEIRLKNMAAGNTIFPSDNGPDVGDDVPGGFKKSHRTAWYILMIQAPIYFIYQCNQKAPQTTAVTYAFPSDFLIKADGTYQDAENQLSYVHEALTRVRDMLFDVNSTPNGHKF